MRPILIICACVAMMVAGHVLRPRYMYMSAIQSPGLIMDGCRDQDDQRVECDEAHTLKPAEIIIPTSCAELTVKCRDASKKEQDDGK